MLRSLAAVPLIAATSAIAQPTDLSAVSAHLKATSSMTASFAQTDRAGKTVTGTLSLKRPGKIRFSYQKGVPLLIVSDGRALTFVDYGVKQVQQWPVKNSPLGVLLDPNRDLSRYARMVESSNASVVTAQVRDPRRPELGTLTLAFTRQPSAPAGLMLQGWVALDNQGNRTTVRLSNQRFNVPVSDEAFKWRDPRPRIKGR